MIDPDSIAALRSEMNSSIADDRRVLDELREDVLPLKGLHGKSSLDQPLPSHLWVQMVETTESNLTPSWSNSSGWWTLAV